MLIESINLTTTTLISPSRLLHLFLDKASIQGLDGADLLSTTLAVVVGLLQGIHHEWDPTQGKEHGRSHDDADPCQSAGVRLGPRSNVSLRAIGAHAQLDWFSTSIQKELGILVERRCSVIIIVVLVHDYGKGVAGPDHKAFDVGFGGYSWN
jgi:hypothetical protein